VFENITGLIEIFFFFVLFQNEKQQNKQHYKACLSQTKDPEF